jgi:hypothetical protein
MSFAWPPAGLVKKIYAPPWVRLDEGKKALAHWRHSDKSGEKYSWPTSPSEIPAER